MKIYNSNERYGDKGPWDLVSIHGLPMTFEETRKQFVAAMTPTFREWALDMLEDMIVNKGIGVEDEKLWVKEKVEVWRKDFHDSLHLYPDGEWRDAHFCPECGSPAPGCYDDEEHPSWECSYCLAEEFIKEKSSNTQQ